MFEPSLATLHRSAPLLLALAALSASGVAAADSDLKKAYNGINCDSFIGVKHWKMYDGYSVRPGFVDEVVCPIERDGTEVDGLPHVLVETYNAIKSTDVTDMQCYVYWLEEDGQNGQFPRGMAVHQTATKAGYVQFSFDSLEEYFLGNGEMTLTAGGEGTMGVICHNLREGDRIIQYYVSEDVF